MAGSARPPGQARARAAETHAGFQAPRGHRGMDCRRAPAPARKAPPEAAHRDVARIGRIWRDCRERADGGPWLFGRFGIADAMYAPVAPRFRTYRPGADAVARKYMNTILGHPALVEWIVAGKAEPEIIPAFED